jgi:hypothetical protein
VKQKNNDTFIHIFSGKLPLEALAISTVLPKNEEYILSHCQHEDEATQKSKRLENSRCYLTSFDNRSSRSSPLMKSDANLLRDRTVNELAIGQ